MMKPLWGKRLPLKTRKDATHKEILEGGLSKWKIFNKAMIEDDENYMLLYDDGSEALFIPGQTQDFFVLSKYSDTFCGTFLPWRAARWPQAKQEEVKSDSPSFWTKTWQFS